LIKSKKLSHFSKINHGFFNRNGGVSNGIYKSLNCGIGSNDKKINVKKNLKIVKKKLGSKSKEIFLVKQFHSNKFIYLDKNSNIKNRSIAADAIITEKKGMPIAVLTADCVPILIYDDHRKMIAAIHAGWRGAYKGIVQKVIQFMLKKGCKPKNIVAAIGPAISKKNYEVQLEFKKRFIKKNKKNAKFFTTTKKLINFDLKGYVKSQIQSNLISKIDLIDIDTFDTKNNFFSARKSLKLKNDDYGRNISVIMIN
jgi:YfiH family protein